jgi:hypothetical protein
MKAAWVRGPNANAANKIHSLLVSIQALLKPELKKKAGAVFFESKRNDAANY